jgi:glycosyltransferase involved in cell wall biosynthesis
MRNLPFVSIVISFHNEEQYIGACLKSLLSLNYPKDLYEIILVNDGSKDGSEKIIKEIIEEANHSVPIILLAQEDKGPSAGRNLGVKASKGEIIAFTDPDCIVDKEWLNQHIKHYQDSTIGGVEGRIETDWNELIIPKKVAPVGYRYVTCNISYRRKTLEEVNIFDEEFKFKEDDDLACRVLKKGWRIVSESKALVYHPVKNLKAIELIKRA